MSLYQRGNTYCIDFTTQSGERIRRSTFTSNKKEAQNLHDKLKSQAWRVDHLGERPQHTWDEAAKKWVDETPGERKRHDDVLKIRWLQSHLGGKMLTDITRDDIAAVGKAKYAESSGATANRHLALIRAILRKAWREWEWIDKVPAVKLYEEPKRRVRWITPEQAKKLLAELPGHQREMVLFALATGLRQGNVTSLQWSQVEMERRTVWIPSNQAKGGEELFVPLNVLAFEILRRQVDKHPERVFTYKGKPITWANTRGWRNALERVGIKGFRWHDLRHTWASWLIQNGTPLYDLQEMGGWKSAAMVRRYAHLAPENLARHSLVIDGLLCDTVASQGAKKHSRRSARTERNTLIRQ